MNENKEILSWHFTKKEKFDFVEDLLSRLKGRVGEELEFFILDNCCKWKNKITSIFGANVLIKLDPFHAIQRIVETLRKKHPFHKQMCQDLQKLLRSEGDSGPLRKEQTAEPNLIMKRLNGIVKKWEALEFILLDQSLITVETRQSILNLQKHIQSGCLSGIPAGCSSGANENLHR